MANRVEGVTEKLLAYAMQEFLAHGYRDASLRTISENAGTTPRSIYTRYGDKEGLFRALVQEPADTLVAMFDSYMKNYLKKPVTEQKTLFHNKKFDREFYGYMQTILDYLFDRHNEFLLLVCKSEGSAYANYLDTLVTLEEKYTLLFIAQTNNAVISSGRAKPELIHLLCSSFVHGFFEVIRHAMSRQDAEIYTAQLIEFYSCGWDNLFNPVKQ